MNRDDCGDARQREFTHPDAGSAFTCLVSSTLQERAAARDAIAALQLTPVLFELGARPHPPQALYRAYLEQSQLFVGIYWQSHGWVAPDTSVSGIEDEYRLSKKLPRLPHVKELAPERERGLRDLLDPVEAEGSVSFKRFATTEELGDLWGIGTTLHAMCRLRAVYDNHADAGDLFERALAAVEQVGDDLGIGLQLSNVACERLAAGEQTEVRRGIGRSLEHMRSAGITYAGDEHLEILARLDPADGEDERAIELLAASDALRMQNHNPLWKPALERHERLLHDLRGPVGDQPSRPPTSGEARWTPGRCRRSQDGSRAAWLGRRPLADLCAPGARNASTDEHPPGKLPPFFHAVSRTGSNTCHDSRAVPTSRASCGSRSGSSRSAGGAEGSR